MLSSCISDQIDAIALLERNVDDDDVRVQFADRGAGFLHRLDFATDHEIVFLADPGVAIPGARSDDRRRPARAVLSF